MHPTRLAQRMPIFRPSRAGMIFRRMFSGGVDVGLVGVLALLAWVVAYCWWMARPAREGRGAAWLVLAVLAVSVVDWLSRTTLGSYPTGFTTLYLLGLATSAALVVRPDRLRTPMRETVA